MKISDFTNDKRMADMGVSLRNLNGAVSRKERIRRKTMFKPGDCMNTDCFWSLMGCRGNPYTGTKYEKDIKEPCKLYADCVLKSTETKEPTNDTTESR